MPARRVRFRFQILDSVLTSIMRILGIDPGSQRTGVGIIDTDTTGKTVMYSIPRWCCSTTKRFRCA